MPIITKPSPLEKAATGIFSLDKTALALHPTVVASAHFSSPNVWDKIILKYKSNTLGQFESVEFDATVASPEGQFFVSATAEDVFEVEKITIIDKDGAILLIPRADLTVAEFDIDFGSVAPELSYFLYNQLGAGHTTDAFGAISSSTSTNAQSFNTTAITGDFDVEYTFDEAIPSSAHDSIFGLKTTLDGQNNYVGFLISHPYALVYFNSGSQGSVAMTQGQNVFRIKRVGSVIDFYHNGVKTLNSHNFSGNLYLVVRANAGFELISTVDKLGTGSNFINWDLLTGYQAGSLTITPTSGVSGGISLAGNDVAVKSDADKATGDFDYTFKFDWSAATSVVDMFAGVTGNDITTGVSFYNSLTCIYGNGNNPDTAYLWHNGSPIGQTQTLLNGENVYRLKRVGTTITHYFNDVEIYSANSTLFTAYPSVRTMGNSVLTEASITISP